MTMHHPQSGFHPSLQIYLLLCFLHALFVDVCVCRHLQSNRRLSSWPSNRLEPPRLRPHLAKPRLLLLARPRSLRLQQSPELLLCLTPYW